MVESSADTLASIAVLKQSLLDEFGNELPGVDNHDVIDFFEDYDLHCSATQVVIPFARPAFQKVLGIIAQHGEPFEMFNQYAEVTDFEDGTQVVQSFAVPGADFSVVVDAHAVIAKQYGPDYARFYTEDSFVHENAHLTMTGSIVTDHSMVSALTGVEYDFSNDLMPPVWLDEAYPGLMAGLYRARHGRVGPGHVFDEWLWLDEHNVSRQTGSDEVLYSWCSFSGQSLVNLDQARRGTIGKLLSVIRGHLDRDLFLDDLRQMTASASLFDAMTQPRPYKSWVDVMDGIYNLPELDDCD